MTMTVGELIRVLSYWSPDTEVQTLDGNLLSSHIGGRVYYGEDHHGEGWIEEIDDGRGAQGNTLYLVTE